ncbi:phosphatase PAP2 family protein [Haloarchaeobius sp. DT45]|uniref:phosphatase PAP2 family protein n=1 Tax=Haloarchaeobius sp. DT45 TaxID=3446116 RepID=UPI003F6D361F
MAVLTRGEWATGVVRALVPDAFAPLLGLLTQLGSPVFLVGLLVLTYWFSDRERGGQLLAVGIASFSLVIVLKHLLLVPRPTVGPPVPVEAVPALLRAPYRLATESSGYAFPSGHALATTVVYLGLARIRGTRRAYAGAVTVVVLVGVTRIYLGVHYLGDVVAGIVVGVSYLAVVTRFLDGREPRVALWLAAGLGTLAVLVTAPDPTSQAMATAGWSLGAAVAWEWLDRDTGVGRAWPVSLAVWRPLALCCVVAGGLSLVLLLAGGSPLASFAVAVLGAVTVVSLPALTAGTPSGAATQRYREP